MYLIIKKSKEFRKNIFSYKKSKEFRKNIFNYKKI
uniref:Uncharacterized protein n=1 Tax=viral metagenome TaxID=1070528 RepID=A0A6C0AD97_9ZZZZ